MIVGNALYFDGENQVYTDLLIKIFEYISAHYGTTIEIHQRVYETSPEAFFGLYKGEVDMIGPNFSIAGTRSTLFLNDQPTSSEPQGESSSGPLWFCSTATPLCTPP